VDPSANANDQRKAFDQAVTHLQAARKAIKSFAKEISGHGNPMLDEAVSSLKKHLKKAGKAAATAQVLWLAHKPKNTS
jgi:hypothetical protein